MKRIQTAAFLLAIFLIVTGPTAALVARLGVLPALEPLTRGNLFGQSLAAQQPVIGWTTIVDRTAQAQLEPWLAERMGWPREKLIRISNGLNFLIDRSSNPGIVFGRNKELYTREMLKDWCLRKTEDYVGELAAHIGETQEKLQRRGKAFVFLMSPNKAALYPDNLPAYCRPPTGTPRTRDRLMALLSERGVRFIDSETIIKDASRNWVSFGRYGQHWNNLGQFYAVRAVVQEIERQLRRKLATLELADVSVDRQPVFGEADTGMLLNLPFELHPVSPHAKVVVAERGSPIDLIVVGTSFMDGLIGPMLVNGIAKRVTSYNYFRNTFRYEPTKWPSDRSPELPPDDFPRVIENADAVVLDGYSAQLWSGHLQAFTDAVAASH